MSRKRFTAEKIIGMLREAEVVLAQGKKVGRFAAALRYRSRATDEVLNREMLFTLKEAKIVIENWRREYNPIRPHSSLNYRPPAPEAVLPLGLQEP